MSLPSLKNTDSVFRKNRIVTVVSIVMSGIVMCVAMALVSSAYSAKASSIYLFDGQRVLRASAADVSEVRPAEARSHVERFHQTLFTLSPDREAIDRRVARAFELGDESLASFHETLEENSFYTNLISSNTSQEIVFDDIAVDVAAEPHTFSVTAELILTRPTSITKRTLVTTGYLRDLLKGGALSGDARTDFNPHAYLIEHFRVVSNETVSTVKRRFN